MILSWDKDIDSEFTLDLKLYLENRRGIVAELAGAITQAEANIEKNQRGRTRCPLKRYLLNPERAWPQTSGTGGSAACVPFRGVQ